jgi:hypothetical protein
VEEEDPCRRHAVEEEDSCCCRTVEEEDPCRRRAVEEEDSCCCRAVEEEDLRRRHAVVEEPRRGGGGPTLWRSRSPPPWRRTSVEDPGGDEMLTHVKDKPSKSYSSSDPWRAPAIELPQPLESSSSSSTLESYSRPFETLPARRCLLEKEREERGKKRDRNRYLLSVYSADTL